MDWRASNRARWEELAAVHLAPGGYDLAALRAGTSRLDPLVAAELGDPRGRRILHLQCHFGWDSLTLARAGAEVVGLDFSATAIQAARGLAAELGLADRTRFVQADLYDAQAAIAEPGAFDVVFVTWGAINWLPDIAEWARVVTYFLKPGGCLYLADQHPAAFVFDDANPQADGSPGFFIPYFRSEAVVFENVPDYSNQDAVLAHGTEHVFAHPLGDIVTAVIDAGLRLDFLHEHDGIAWRMFKGLVEGPDGLFRWPGEAWLPLSFSLRAARPPE